jgi:hypothetical protein
MLDSAIMIVVWAILAACCLVLVGVVVLIVWANVKMARSAVCSQCHLLVKGRPGDPCPSCRRPLVSPFSPEARHEHEEQPPPDENAPPSGP